MNNIITFLVLFFGTIFLSMLLPWWIIAPLALGICYVARLSSIGAILVSFFGVFFAWILSIYFYDSDGLVSGLLGSLFKLSDFAMPIVAGLVGGLLASLFGWSGSLLANKKS